MDTSKSTRTTTVLSSSTTRTPPPTTTQTTLTTIESTTSLSTTTTTSSYFTSITSISPSPRATVTSSFPESTSETNFPIVIVAGIGIFIALACCIFGIYLLYVRRSKDSKAQVQLAELLDNQSAKTVPSSSQGYPNVYKFGSSQEIEQIPDPYYPQETAYYDPYVDDGGYVVPTQPNEYYADAYDQYALPQNSTYYDQGAYTPESQVYYSQQNNHRGYYDQQFDHQYHGDHDDQYYESNASNIYNAPNDPKRETLMSTDSEAYQQFRKINPTKRETMTTITSADSEDFYRYDNNQAINSKKSPKNTFRDSIISSEDN